MKALDEVAENYFNTLNPIAERISTDILSTKEAYEDLWNCLSVKERNQIVNDAIVHPEALLKYALNSNSYDDSDVDLPFESKSTGSKYVVDENTGMLWRDEHSAPFSWKTPSQIDLSIFTTSSVGPQAASGGFAIKSKNKLNQSVTDSLETDKRFFKKFDSVSSHSHEKNDSKKTNLPPDSSNVVLVGTYSKLSGLCSRLKFLPGKSYNYEVQTVVADPANASNEESILGKIKSTAVLKLQSTFKLVGGKMADKKLADSKDTENLVQFKGGATVVKVSKVSPKIAKPKYPPPPPPPVLNLALKNEKKPDGDSGKNLITVKITNDESYHDEIDSEKGILLEGNSSKSILLEDPDALERDLQTDVVREISDDFNSLSTECTPLSGPCTDPIPKSGFDFLDNW